MHEYEPGWPVLLEETWRFLGVDLDNAPAANGWHAHQENGHGSDLSSREREVLSLIAGHKSNAAIAEALTISPATAAKHVHNILGKLGMSRRSEAAAWWASHGNGQSSE
jgi:DNA-binding CsgD family transcriptional regulator